MLVALIAATMLVALVVSAMLVMLVVTTSPMRLVPLGWGLIKFAFYLRGVIRLDDSRLFDNSHFDRRAPSLLNFDLGSLDIDRHLSDCHLGKTHQGCNGRANLEREVALNDLIKHLANLSVGLRGRVKEFAIKRNLVAAVAHFDKLVGHGQGRDHDFAVKDLAGQSVFLRNTLNHQHASSHYQAGHQLQRLFYFAAVIRLRNCSHLLRLSWLLVECGGGLDVKGQDLESVFNGLFEGVLLLVLLQLCSVDNAAAFDLLCDVVGFVKALGVETRALVEFLGERRVTKGVGEGLELDLNLLKH